MAALCAAAVLVAAGQWVARAIPRGSAVLIPRVLGLCYATNTGISFSLLGGSLSAMRAVSVVTGLALLAGAALILAGRVRGCYIPGAALVLAGGACNLFERLFHGGVVDYFEFLFVRFAIFNLADVLITCGAIWLAAWMLVLELRARKKA
jgi:signal peptidase II